MSKQRSSIKYRKRHTAPTVAPAAIDPNELERMARRLVNSGTCNPQILESPWSK